MAAVSATSMSAMSATSCAPCQMSHTAHRAQIKAGKAKPRKPLGPLGSVCRSDSAESVYVDPRGLFRLLRQWVQSKPGCHSVPFRDRKHTAGSQAQATRATPATPHSRALLCLKVSGTWIPHPALALSLLHV
ncbi:unnamed protein product [Effrenium voratum]|uniref:Uncharacterized protein n=1 Tax=Effrenium voratum TaxID=2562239 RepID=A0AA36IM44_9DINO|nr:unnamed protein product [Effrenium voratum]